MTRAQFEKKHKSNIKHGFDDLDGADVWKEFQADLTLLLESERNKHALLAGNTSCKYGDIHDHCECAFWAKKAIEDAAS